MKTNNNLKKDFILYNPERKEEDERAKHRDCAYYENRLNIIIGEFSNISSLSVREFYYDLYSELLDEYKEFLAKKNEAGKVDYYESEKIIMMVNKESGFTKKLVK